MKYLRRVAAVLLTAVVLFTSVSVEVSQAARKVRLNKTKAALAVGDKVQLRLKGTAKRVKWSSNKKKVAAVSAKGRVTAKKVGKAVITAKAAGKKYQCRITVTAVESQSTASPTPAPTAASSAKPKPTATAKAPQNAAASAEPSAGTLSYDAGEYSLSKVHSGEGTYYDRNSVGAANLDDMEELYYTVAMNSKDYMNGLAGAYIQITDKDGDTVNALVTDRLPEGKKGDVDMTRATFAAIEPLETGRMKITWKIIPLPTSEPISYLFKPSSSQYWAEVQVRGGRYPISKVEYLDEKTGKYIELERKEYNYFAAPSGMGKGPFTFRVTDFYGHVLTDTGIALNTQNKAVKGAANFPY